MQIPTCSIIFPARSTLPHALCLASPALTAPSFLSSFLIAGNPEAVIPVGSVEQGRWAYRSTMFSYAEKVIPPRLRKEKQKKVGENLSRGGPDTVRIRERSGTAWPPNKQGCPSILKPGPWPTFSKFFKKLIQSYPLDAIDVFEEPKADHVAAADIRRFKALRRPYEKRRREIFQI